MGNTYKFTEYPNALYGALSEVAKENEVYYLTEGKTSIADNETVISTLMFAELIMEQVEKDLVSEDAQVKARAVKMSELASKISFGGVESENSQTGEIEFREYTEAEMQSFMKELVELAKEKNSTISLGFRFYDDMDGNYEGDVKEYVVAGILNNKYQRVEYVLFNDKTAEALWDIHKEGLDFFYEYRTKYTEPEDIIYQTIFLPYNHSDEQTNMLWDIYENEKLDDNDSKSTISSMLIANLEAVDEIIKALSKVFLYAGIIMAVFAALLLSNFISVSISYKKREIGILRAVGARSIDVFKIFFSESFVITAICVILSLLGSVAICAAVNGILVNLIGASLFVFGPLSLCILLAVAIVTAVVATFLPVWNAAKKKPVESIRAL